MSEQAQHLLDLVGRRGWTLSVAESLTGGLLAATIVEIPGASASFRGGVVSYATDLKHSLLGVDASLLAARGAVDAEVARQMARGVREATAQDGVATDVGVSTTGIAGPESPDGQPVGAVHIGVCTPQGEAVDSRVLSGSREQIRRTCVQAALAAACRLIAS